MKNLKLDRKVEDWTKNEIDFLKKSFLEMDLDTIAEKLGRTYDAVGQKARQTGLVTNRRWTKREDTTLKKLYHRGTITIGEIAEQLGRTWGMVQRRSAKMGLYKSKHKHWTKRGDS